MNIHRDLDRTVLLLLAYKLGLDSSIEKEVLTDFIESYKRVVKYMKYIKKEGGER